MIVVEKVVVLVLIKEDPENTCAKCCKTVQVIDKMKETITEFKNRVDIVYKYIISEKVIEPYGSLEPPAIFINGEMFSQGHVPIIKKLSRKLLNILNKSN